jgi:integrase
MDREHPGTRALRSVTEEQAEAYAADLTASKMTGATFNHHISFLKLAWRVLRKKAKLDRNPWADIAMKRIITNGRRELTIEELRTVCGAATGEMRTLFALGLYTGMRRGDCATLRWCEVDLVRGIIRRVPNKTARRNPKPVLVPLHPTLRAMLTEISAPPPAWRVRPARDGRSVQGSPHRPGQANPETLCLLRNPHPEPRRRPTRLL